MALACLLVCFPGGEVSSGSTCGVWVDAGKYYYLPNASDAVVSAATKEALTQFKNT